MRKSTVGAGWRESGTHTSLDRQKALKLGHCLRCHGHVPLNFTDQVEEGRVAAGLQQLRSWGFHRGARPLLLLAPAQRPLRFALALPQGVGDTSARRLPGTSWGLLGRPREMQRSPPAFFSLARWQL